jgi:hypothetical protein
MQAVGVGLVGNATSIKIAGTDKVSAGQTALADGAGAVTGAAAAGTIAVGAVAIAGDVVAGIASLFD